MDGKKQFNKFCINPNKDEGMKIKLSKIIIAIVVLILLVLAGRFGFTVVPIEDVEKAIQSEIFNPVVYVDEIWGSKILPTFEENSVELSKILNEIHLDENGTSPKDDLVAITNEYGLVTVGEALVYMVEGSGVISAVNTETSLGTVEISVEGYSGPIKVLLYVGPRIPSDETSVRDAVGFITFGDFKEQTEYGKVSSEINKRVLTEVIGDLDKDQLLGKSISFKGAFNIRTFNLIQIDLKEIKIVPVQITVGE
jgi:predicted lipoprotein